MLDQLDQPTNKAFLVKPEDGTVIREIQTEALHASGITYGNGALWIGSTKGKNAQDPPKTMKVDPRTGKTLKQLNTPGSGLYGRMSARARRHPVWRARPEMGRTASTGWPCRRRTKCFSWSPRPARSCAAFLAPGSTPRTHGMAIDKGMLWVINSDDRAIFKLDPKNGTVVVEDPAQQRRSRSARPRHRSQRCAVVLRRGLGLDLQAGLKPKHEIRRSGKFFSEEDFSSFPELLISCFLTWETVSARARRAGPACARCSAPSTETCSTRPRPPSRSSPARRNAATARAYVGIAHAVVPQQLGAEIVDQLFVGSHPGRAPPVGDRSAISRLRPSFNRDRIVHVPFVLLREVARCDEDDELVQLRRKHRAISEVVAHRHRTQHHFGAAMQRHERTEDVLLAVGAKRLSRLPLLGRLFLGRNRRQSILSHGAAS